MTVPGGPYRLSVATQTYVHRVDEVGQKAPELLVGHLYTRDLGDLSSRHVLRGLISRVCGLSDDTGTMFYRVKRVPAYWEAWTVY